MAQEIFIGRKQEQNEFRQVLRSFQRTWVEENLPTFVKLAGKAQSRPEPTTIFLFYGEGGMGKTTLVKELMRIAKEEPFEASKPSPNQFQTLYLDWELHKHDPEIAVGHDQLQPDEVLTVLHRAVATQFREVKAFKDVLVEMQELEQKVDTQLKQPPQTDQESLKQEVLDLGAKGLAWAVRTAAASQTGPMAAALGGATTERLARVGIELSAEGLSQLNRIVNQVLTTEERDIYARPQEKLASALGAGLAEIAQRKPLVIVLDTYEIVDQTFCDYALRKVIQTGGGRILWVVAGRANLADSEHRGQIYFRGYRQDFSEQIYPRKLGEFGPEELQKFFIQKVPEHPIDDDQATALSQFSQGIPFVINLAAEQWTAGVPFNDIIAPPEDAAADRGHYQIIRITSERFLKHCLDDQHRADRQAVYALAIMRRPEANLLRAMLDVAELKPRLQELRQRYSFILPEGLQLDNKLKSFLKDHLQSPVERSEPLIQELNQRALVWLDLQIEQATQGKTDRADWLTDEDTGELLLDYAYHCFWQNDDTRNLAGWKNLAIWLVEGWQYSSRWARQLLLVAEGFGRQFSTAEQRRLVRLQAGLVTQAEIEAEAELLEELNKWAEWGWLAGEGEEERQAILTLKQGRLLYRRKQYEQALSFYSTAQRQIPNRAVTLIRGLSGLLRDLGYQMGREGRNTKDYDKAVAVYQQAIELDPQNAYHHNSLGNVYRDQKDYDKAIEAYQQAIELDPKYASPHNGLGIVYREQKDYDKAIEAYQQAIELDFQNAYPHNNLGNLYRAQKDYDKAIEAYQNSLKLPDSFGTPTSAHTLAHNSLGNVYRDQKDYDKAIEAYQQAIELDPKYTSPHNGLGNVYRDQKDYDKAIEAYQQAIELDFQNAYPHNNLGNLYRAQKDYDKAIEAYQNSLKLPDSFGTPANAHTLAHNGLGNLYRDQKDYNKAIEAYQQAIELDPKYAPPHNNLGIVYHDQKDYDKAIEAYRQAIELDPKYAPPHNNLGNVYHDQKDYDKAIETYRQAIELDPKYTSPHNGLGNVYRDQKDYDQAIEAYRQAIELDPKDASLHYNLGIVYRDQKDYNKAIEAYRQAIELDPKYASPHNNLGIVYHDQKDYDQAIEAYRQAIELDPKDASLHYNLGFVYYFQKDYEKAIVAFQQAIQINPNNANSHNNLGWLQLRGGELFLATEHLQQAIAIDEEDGLPRLNLGTVSALQGNLTRARELWRQALPLYVDGDDCEDAKVTIYTIALGTAFQGLADLEALIEKGVSPAAVRGALEDAEILMKCPTSIEGIEEAVALLREVGE